MPVSSVTSDGVSDAYFVRIPRLYTACSLLPNSQHSRGPNIVADGMSSMLSWWSVWVL